MSRVGSGRVGSGRVGSGRVGSGRVGSGRVGSVGSRISKSRGSGGVIAHKILLFTRGSSHHYPRVVFG